MCTLGVPGEIKRRQVELDPEVNPEEIMSREVVPLRKLDFFRFGLFLNSSATDISCPCDSAQHGS